MAHLYKQKHPERLGWVLVALCFALAGLVLLLASSGLSRGTRERQTALLQDTLQQAISSCYAIEGRYPESLAYLTAHYGVLVDEEQYLVIYDIFAENIRPQVQVIWIGGD